MSKQFPEELQKKMVDLYKEGMSAREIGRNMNLFCTSITRVLKRHNCKMKSGKGKEHSQWKGGRGLKSGYWTVYNPYHPRALNNGRVWEHILIMEKHLNRTITKDEPIHHMDYDRKNNAIKNLYVCKSHSEHQEIHKSLEEVAVKLYKKGFIKFKDGKYV